MNPKDLIENGLLRASDLEGDFPSMEGADLGPLGRYQVLEEVGRGGSAIVYRARDPLLNRVVALKRLRFGDPELESRFLRESGLLARLSHPGIIPIFDFGREGESLYYTMPLVAGRSMDGWIAERRPDPREAARVVRETAEALAHAHEHGVLHRDVKPANILVSAQGSAQLADFGLGRAEEPDAPEAGRITESGLVMGTPSYMAPELAAGDLKRVDARCDIYSLGATLYEALTGQPPFMGESSLDILKRVTTEEPSAPRRLAPGVPADLEVICLKALEKDPARRYATAREFADDLGRFLAGEPIHARRAGALYRLRRLVARRRALVAVAAAGVAAALGILIYGLIREDSAAARRNRVSGHLEAARRHHAAMDVLLRDKAEDDPAVKEQAGWAFESIERALLEDPGNADSHYLKGKTHALRFDEAGARLNYDIAIRNGPIAQACLERAIMDCQELLEAVVNRPQAADRRRTDPLRNRIQEDLNKARALAPKSPESEFASAMLEVAKVTPQGYQKAAQILADYTSRTRDWRAMYWKGLAEMHSERLAGARQSFEEALKGRSKGKTASVILDCLAIVLYELKEVDASVRRFEESIDQNPELPGPRFNLARVLLEDRNDADGAILQVERVLQLEGNAPQADAHALRGFAYVRKHEKNPAAAGRTALLAAKESLEVARRGYLPGSEDARDIESALKYVEEKLMY